MGERGSMNTVLLGPPGAGKGTQAAHLAETAHLLHISTGELLRDAVASGTALGQEAKGYMDRGALVPDALVLALLEQRLADLGDRDGFLLDGFPRNVAQAEELDAALGAEEIRHVVYLQLDDEEILSRLLRRGRPDDVEEVIRNRLRVYRAETEPLVAHYRERGLLRPVDGLGAVEEVEARIRRTLGLEQGASR